MASNYVQGEYELFESTLLETSGSLRKVPGEIFEGR